jgi:hypothetical protein
MSSKKSKGLLATGFAAGAAFWYVISKGEITVKWRRTK